MRPAWIAAAVAVLGVAAYAGVGFSGCGPPTTSALIWINPSGAATPAAHTFIRCSETGKNTPSLGLSASDLGPGDGCQFSASLANTGQQTLVVTERGQVSTARGDPPFSSCFGYSVSSGPPTGRIPGGGSYPYTFMISMLSSATSACEGAVGTVQLTFTGAAPCGSGWGSPPWGTKLGPGANLKGANLAGLNLAGLDMAADNLAGANLTCDNLQGTDLAGANLQGATLDNSVLTAACLQLADLVGAQLAYTTLSGANFQGADLQNANLTGAYLTGFPYDLTNFGNANLEGLNLAFVVATGYITATGATITGALNVGSCVTASGSSVYCDEL